MKKIELMNKNMFVLKTVRLLAHVSPSLQPQPVLSRILFQDLLNWHRPRVAALLKAGADILALETIPAQVHINGVKRRFFVSVIIVDSQEFDCITKCIN